MLLYELAYSWRFWIEHYLIFSKNELANLVDEESGEVAGAKTPVSQQSTIAVDIAMVQRLQQLNTDYTAAVKTANAEGNSAKARRYT